MCFLLFWCNLVTEFFSFGFQPLFLLHSLEFLLSTVDRGRIPRAEPWVTWVPMEIPWVNRGNGAVQ
jgi:hypothetical protein